MPFLSKIRLNGTLYDLKVAGDAMVTGVKGNAESDYRVGDVNITPENVGTISTENTQSLTDTQKSTARDNLGLGSAATRSVPASGNANATQVVLGSDTRLTGSYKTDDSASTTINDTDYVPMSETDGTKKKTLWSTIVAKVKSALATVATSGSYNDLSNKPALKTVATSGSYTDLTDKPNYALSPSAGGAASNVYTSRSSSGDYNDDLPGKNKTKIVEHGTSSANRPADFWFFVVTMQGGDTAYATQVAYGMTTNSNYCRRMDGGTWGAWRPFRNPTGNATAAQVLSGYTASNASSDGFSGSIPVRSSGGTQALTGGHDGASAYAYFPYGYYPSYTSISGTSAAYIYIAQSYVKNMHKHSDTWTPSASQYNSSGAEMGEIHNYRKVNTAVCYSAGVSAADSTWLGKRLVYWNHISAGAQAYMAGFKNRVIVVVGTSSALSITGYYGVNNIYNETPGGLSIQSFNSGNDGASFLVNGCDAYIFVLGG